MTINTKMTTVIASFLVVGLLAGCASGPDRSERDFGNSVRAMTQAQTLDPVAARNPDMTPVTLTDGQRIENVLDNYREDVSRRPPATPATGAIAGQH